MDFKSFEAKALDIWRVETKVEAPFWGCFERMLLVSGSSSDLVL